MKLSYVRIFVRDLDVARSFYRDKLGLSLRAHSAESGYCVFESGAAQLVVEAVPNEAPADDQVLVGRPTGVSFAVESVANVYQRLVALGVPFTGAPETQTWGGILATFKDPAGNELQLVQANAG